MVFVVFVVLFSGTVFAMDESQYQHMLSLYKQAVDGNSDARDEVKAYLENLSKAEPNDAIVRVYLGSTMVLEGRDAWMPWNKMKFTEKGMDVMEQALDMSTKDKKTRQFLENDEDIEIRMICAFTFTQVPKMMGRFEQGLELLKGVGADPRFEMLSSKKKAHYYYYRGAAATMEDDIELARKYYQMVFDMDYDEELKAKTEKALGSMQ